MVRAVACVTIIVDDLDVALNWYTEKLGLEKKVDAQQGTFRYLSIGAPGQRYPEIILQKPDLEHHGKEGYERKLSQIGNGTNWIFEVENCAQSVQKLRAQGVKIVRELQGPKPLAMIEDLYGNTFTLRQMDLARH